MLKSVPLRNLPSTRALTTLLISISFRTSPGKIVSGILVICCQLAHLAATLKASQPATTSYLPIQSDPKNRTRSRTPSCFPPPLSPFSKNSKPVGNFTETLHLRKSLDNRPRSAVINSPAPMAVADVSIRRADIALVREQGQACLHSTLSAPSFISCACPVDLS